MRMTLNSTDEFVELDGKRCRVWDGVTDRAVRVQVYVAAVRVDAADDCEEFDRELVETAAPEFAPA